MNPLMLLSPEKAHKMALWALKNGLGPKAAADDPALQVEMFGKAFSNPIGLAAGADKRAESLKGWARMGFGFVEAGTACVAPRPGNPAPRLWRLGDHKSVVNWMGLPGIGVEAFTANLKAFQASQESKRMCVGASIASPDGLDDEFSQLSATVAPHCDFITLNPSCPNVVYAEGVDKAAQITEQLKLVLAEAGDKRVMLKLGPCMDAEYLKRLVNLTMEAGAAGYVAMNCLHYGDRNLIEGGDKIDWPKHDGQQVGGYSGAKLLPVSEWMVREVRAVAGPKAVIMGCGGVQSGEDAMRLMRAGANAVQLYTGLIYKGAGLLKDIKQDFLADHAGEHQKAA